MRDIFPQAPKLQTLASDDRRVNKVLLAFCIASFCPAFVPEVQGTRRLCDELPAAFYGNPLPSTMTWAAP